MPLYLVSSVVMLTTLPTGRIFGSDAAMPVRTPTPDAVVVPLQYAVALKVSRDPAAGAVGSTAPWRAALRESIVVTSYSSTNVTIATMVASSLRQSDREMIRFISESVRIRPAAAGRLRVSGRHSA